MKALLILCVVSLLLGLFNLPIGYYTFLRIIVFIGCVGVLVENEKFSINSWNFIFIIVGVLFNPIFPVYLNQKKLWLPIDLLSAAVFLIKVFSSNKSNKI